MASGPASYYLRAEADIPYDKLIEMDDINPEIRVPEEQIGAVGEVELVLDPREAQVQRLLGIYASHFGEAKPQLALFDEPRAPSPLDEVRDAVAKRFGDESITRASLLGRRERRNRSDKPPQ